MIKLFTDQSYLSPENRTVVFPLLFDLWYLPNSNLVQKYKLVDSVESCDIAVVPVDLAHYGNEKTFDDFVANALKHGKKIWVYTAGDYGKTIPKPVFTFRTAGFDSKLDKNTFILPSFITDPFVHLEQQFKPLSKTALPAIGFVGHANNSLLKRLKEVLVFLKYRFALFTNKLVTDSQKFYPSSVKRFQLLQILERQNNVKTDFIYREKYKGGFKNQEDKEKSIFFQNIQQNPYIFCLRGAGNFSVRFYETLAMGRIPFVIDTDFRLPLNQIIDWQKHCVIASEKNVVDTLVTFHKNITSQDFIQLQKDNRKLWLEFLEREAYFIKIHTIFKRLLNEI
jgi:hypothetical protein